METNRTYTLFNRLNGIKVRNLTFEQMVDYLAQRVGTGRNVTGFKVQRIINGQTITADAEMFLEANS
jgi:hypothetical protein